MHHLERLRRLLIHLESQIPEYLGEAYSNWLVSLQQGTTSDGDLYDKYWKPILEKRVCWLRSIEPLAQDLEDVHTVNWGIEADTNTLNQLKENIKVLQNLDLSHLR